MTTRTASLLFLFVAAVILTGPVMGLVLRSLEGFDIAGMWLGVVVVVLSVSVVLFAGRRYILPMALTQSRTAFAVIALISAVTFSVALASAWLLQAVIGPRLPYGPVRGAIWFAGLWFAVDALHRREAARRYRLP